MTMRPLIEHGGEPSLFDLPEPTQGWLDLSTGINPIAYPVPDIDISVWQRLPRAADAAALNAAARRYYNVNDASDLVAAPGTQVLIERLPTLFSSRNVAILSPTYGEHAACWAAAGHEVLEIDDISRLPDETRIVVVVRPNNPTGTCLPRPRLIELHRTLRARDGLLVVDEAFGDLTPQDSVCDLVGPGLLVLKSFGKFFGLAGLRLGFAIADPGLAAKLDTLLGLWRVSGPALVLASRAYTDTSWINATRDRLARDAQRLDGMLPYPVIGGTDLFRLAEIGAARAEQRRLAEHGVLVRAFDHSPTVLRFGIPGVEAEWQRLAAALKR